MMSGRCRTKFGGSINEARSPEGWDANTQIRPVLAQFLTEYGNAVISLEVRLYFLPGHITEPGPPSQYQVLSINEAVQLKAYLSQPVVAHIRFVHPYPAGKWSILSIGSRKS